jgi:hypothetical protein
MTPEYPYFGKSLSAWQILGSLLLLLAISTLVVLNRRQRYLLVGWLWFLGTLVPMIGVIQVGFQGMADRYSYQAFIGLFIIVCWGVADWARGRISQPMLAGAAVLILVALTTASYRQIGYWKDNFTLWTHALEVTTNNWAAEDNVGNILFRQGKTAEAMPYYFRAAASNPNDAISNLRIAIYEQSRGQRDEAIRRYERALHDFQLGEGDVKEIYLHLGAAYRDKGDFAKANECFAKAASLRTQ